MAHTKVMPTQRLKAAQRRRCTKQDSSD
jgi:hypothetical protein